MMRLDFPRIPADQEAEIHAIGEEIVKRMIAGDYREYEEVKAAYEWDATL